ncbi:MAG: aminoacyl-tRNA hydrolase [Sphaerochaetaceae bacterium]|nr:aminoacyl-tRNA hydrolase [Sphaerochaetaceae bacterium]
MQLTVFGLGNPGKKYELTLHNAGFEATDRLAAFLGGKTRKRCLRRYKAFSAQEGTAGIVQDVLIVQPLTFMNSSGVIAHWFDLKDEGNTVVAVCDNMDLEPGMVRVRWVQSRSTHKGLRSLQENMPDVRILAVFVGIGRPAEG